MSQEIEEVVVSGSFIQDEKRDTSEISAILDSSEIERTEMIILPYSNKINSKSC